MQQCPNPDICGSCGFSHLKYEDQLAQKKHLVNCAKIIPSPKTTHYRNRMDFVINYQGKVGLREKGKWWSVIDNHTCFIANEKIEEKFAQVRKWVQTCGLSFYDRKGHQGLLRYAVIRATTTGETMINIITSQPTQAEPESLITSKLNDLHATTVIWSVNKSDSDISYGDEIRIIKGDGYINEIIADLKFLIRPNSFFQTNSHGAKELLDLVVSFAKDVKPAKILDLYCGGGFFSLGVKKAMPDTEIYGIELVEDAILDAKDNATSNNLDIEFSVGKAEDLNWETYKPDLVILDPPRSGLHPKVLKTLLELEIPNLIYVSCKYQSFAKDYQMLSTRYKAKDCVAVDMFPQTEHVELVTFLKLQ
ncbi:23S rRNA (uracil-5-)-methyltransferase RumA [candidate division WWE3 bacterium RIFOXYC1_FULL_40_10]|uniref:23S rRNA (Uracil-5-)-methyltransferase RumA n=1 Tax=candidate division WWE3 bacterium RIFOXYA2_FULL_46_9 TaxID=1802636 RepID=A0A1F4W184_UNCKA|nr:MAG: 23S rRNA (uracil-5-)-methyltransferase RumA [candidate division WWE3 bacterium RIFOXYB1_FULL_40_22]OGC62148.1 MAG: 23S rRNA (uracil-5-)-methyltransferase RumA [candidate division WWE3 bacterium RIFOXYA1_FULL_40_11]OGC63161.1 MAG: 23S rRNA (uracil-5-)-methyltransferase RumA [candidate division WWE3 bacterium RIFOXYA2_FULL_46_9]OGC65241.1 MAG: 23S rRNA (uracil-5-)-methyltransferase RumA [candidate division WWE3 bacterium RIFOXYB2_FULL_41_6]OGC66531.1 MAG: 23S rRNA (uracil-5-)-methyltransf